MGKGVGQLRTDEEEMEGRTSRAHPKPSSSPRLLLPPLPQLDSPTSLLASDLIQYLENRRSWARELEEVVDWIGFELVFRSG